MGMSKFVECASTGTKLPEHVAREVDSLTKTLPADCGYRTKAIAADQITFEEGERADISVLTTNSVDKTNEVVLPEGVDMDAYRKSMVVLWNHDQERPVASCKWIKHYRDSIRAKTVYPQEGPQLTQDAWLMTKSGILKAKSIGFIPRKPLREATSDELEMHPEWKGAGLWDDVLLIEYSCCTIGMNNDALVEAVNTKSLHPETFLSLGIEIKADDDKKKDEPYGDVKYADPGYQDDKEKRYPIDTEEHIRAAWNYFNKRKDDDKYTAEQRKEIRDRIIAAWKDKIDPKGPPEAQEEEKAVPSWIVKAESNPCVSDKIKYMHDHGETSKYSDAQIVAIAYSMCAKKTKKKLKKSLDINKVLAEALQSVDLDVTRIVRRALDAHKNRGRV